MRNVWILSGYNRNQNMRMRMRGKNKNSNTKNILRSFPPEILFLISVANIFLALVVDCMTAFSEQRFYVIMTSLLQVKLHTSRLTYCRIHTRMCWVTTSMYVSFTKYFEGWRKINMLIFQINGCIWRLWSQWVEIYQIGVVLIINYIYFECTIV